jgi:hypothetical protein
MNTITMARDTAGLFVPAKYWAILMMALAGLFLIGLDQGQTLSIFMGQTAHQMNFVHELFHDVRHAVGFVCH